MSVKNRLSLPDPPSETAQVLLLFLVFCLWQCYLKVVGVALGKMSWQQGRVDTIMEQVTKDQEITVKIYTVLSYVLKPQQQK